MRLWTIGLFALVLSGCASSAVTLVPAGQVVGAPAVGQSAAAPWLKFMPAPVVSAPAVPLVDADGDGVVDAADRCPSEKEENNGYEDADGCADVVVLNGDWGIPGGFMTTVLFAEKGPQAMWGTRGKASGRPAFAEVVTEGAPGGVITGVEDGGHYAAIRDDVRAGRLPPRGRVDIGALLGRFVVGSSGGDSTSVTTELGPCPWAPEHRLLHVVVRAPARRAKPRDLVVLVDVSDSMRDTGRLAEVMRGLQAARLGPEDRVALATYASNGAVLLAATAADRKAEIFAAIERLVQDTPGRSTGLSLAYSLLPARTAGRTRHIVVMTDGEYTFGPYDDGKWPMDVAPLIRDQVRGGVALSVVQVAVDEGRWPVGCELAERGGGSCMLATSSVDIADALDRVGASAPIVARGVRAAVRFDTRQVIRHRSLHGAPQGYESPGVGAALRAGETWTGLFELTMARGTEPPSEPLATVTVTGGGLAIRRVVNRAAAATTDEFRTAAAVAWLGLLLRDAAPRAAEEYAQLLALAREAMGGRSERRELVTLLADMQEKRGALEAQRAAITRWVRAHPADPLPAFVVPRVAQMGLGMRLFAGVRFVLIGHSDDREGSGQAALQAIAEARAWAVAAQLILFEGIEPARIEVRGAGPREPIDSNATARGRSLNRRVEWQFLQ